jgi:PAS domain S-box-containing protein
MDVEPVKILLVDDRPANLLALESALAGPGYELVKAESGAEALRFLLKGECALILMDVNMPELDGYETARLVRQNPRTRNIPIVFITAYGADERQVQAGYESGAVDYLFKPVSPHLLRCKVAAFAELHRTQRQVVAQAEQLRQHERREHALALAQLELQSLRRQEAAQRRHRALLEGITHAVVWVVDPVTLVCRFASPSAKALLGHAPARWTAEADLWRRSLHPGDRDRLLTAVAALEPGSAGTSIQHRFVRADGSVAWFETALRLLPDEEGNRLELRGFSVEITEVVEGRAALELLARASAELFTSLDCRAVVERAAAMGLALADGCVVEIEDVPAGSSERAVAHAEEERRGALAQLAGSPGLRRLVGDAPELILDPAARLAGEAGRELGPSLAALAPAGVIHVPLAGRDQRVGTLLLFCAGARPPGPRELAVAEELGRRVAQAVENALLYGRAREAIQLRERFLSIASHELRTPLAALLLQTRVLDQAVASGRIPVPEPSREELLRRIRGSVKQVERLGSLVNSLFDLARIRSGRLVLEREPCDLGAVAREVAERFEDVLSRQGRGLTVDASEEPVVGRWDRGRVDQALTNLVANAVKHGARGGVAIRIERRGPAARLEVRDAGGGIPEQDRTRIFELFEQGERGGGGGLGLGLYITRRIAEAHGGRIWVEPAPDGGSVFQVELPLEQADVVESPEPAVAAPAQRQAAQG